MPPFKTIFFIVFTSLALTVQGQTKQQLFAKADTLKAVLSRADTLSPFSETVGNVSDTISSLNEEIATRLTDILTSDAAMSVNLDSLLEAPSLGMVHSKDKRLWIFNWYENTGGSWKSNISLVHYRTQDNKPKLGCVSTTMQEEQSEFCSNGAWFNKIYKLRAKSKDLYLCIGRGISCNTCIYQIATVVELTKDSINFTYPAFGFKQGADAPSDSKNQACFILDARVDDIKKFEFNPRSQTLTSVYLADDNTPVRSTKQKFIIEQLVFDGVQFVEKRYK